MNRRIAASAALLWALGPGAANAQEAVKPEVMLVIDTSGSMQHIADPNGGLLGLPVCLLRAAAEGILQPQNNPSNRSRMNLLKEGLAGSSAEPYRCIEEALNLNALFADPNALDDDGVAANYRSMCCSRVQRVGPVSRCVAFAPCGDDTLNAGPDLSDLDGAIRRDGLIQANETRVKFGLMASDGDATVANSFGDEHTAFDVPLAIANDAARALALRAPNLGVRPMPAGDAPERGALVPGGRGLRNDNVDHPQLVVGEDDDQIRRHNDYVMRQLRALVPVGYSPTAPMLNDLVTYYDLSRGADPPLSDPSYACRKRSAVFFSDGGSTDYYQGANCVGDCANEGYPYEPSTVYASRLAELNVPLFVVSFAGGAAG
ncbi:MAG: hypothetical protein KC620_20680, partial [Myxococcales bacterium]|nr:hypothetical protein [Myxococcales bacterium]